MVLDAGGFADSFAGAFPATDGAAGAFFASATGCAGAGFSSAFFCSATLAAAATSAFSFSF